MKVKVVPFILSKSSVNSQIGFIALIFAFLLTLNQSSAQTETIPMGSFIINMGVTPQTIGNSLKPYGMLYDLIKNNRVGFKWVINPSKAKDGIDFSHNGIDYRGGPFIIPAGFRTAAVNARIAYWQTQGVVGATTTADLQLPVRITFLNVPRWTLDKQNGKLVVPYFVNAGIPASAHGGASSSGWKNPSQLDCCDDLFVMPHADPIWSTHQRLFTWNQECRGGIWNACHAGSALENMVNPTNRAQQTNFLTVKDAAFTGTSGNYANSNSLILWGSHADGSPPYTHRIPADPVAQYIGSTDAALLNGSEQIFIPRQSSGTTARWNPGAKIIAYDPTHSNVPTLQGDLRNAASLMIYGRGFDDPNRGYVMHTAAHQFNSCHNSTAALAAQRTFFNYSWLVAQDKAENLSISTQGGNGIVYSGDGRTFTFTIPGGNINNLNIAWESSCGGTFSSNAAAQTLVFTPPASADINGCMITVSVTDPCGRTTTTSLRTVVICDFTAAFTVTNPSCFGGSNGLINFTTSGASAIGTNTWNWLKQGTSVTGTGTGNQISGLSSGAYNVTVTSSVNCTATFTAIISEPANLVIAPTVRSYACFGETGIINVSVAGGTMPYTYAWNGGATTRNRENLTAGTYTITVTDSRGCTASSVSIVTGQTLAFTASSTKTDITCFGLSNGTANVSVSGGAPSYNYLWSDGSTAQNRTGLATGNYVVTISDAIGCTTTTGLSISQPTLLSVVVQTSPPSCPVGAIPPLDADGSISLTISGGTPPYIYLWNSGATTQNRTNLAAGTYSVTITDSKACQKIQNITLASKFSLPNSSTVINR